MKRVDVAVYRVALDAANKRASKSVDLGLKEAGVDLTEFKYTRQTIGDFNLLRLRELRQAIVDGRIVPPQTREELARFKPVKY